MVGSKSNLFKREVIMEIFGGEIKVFPKVIYWVEMPILIKEEIFFELLRRDVIVVPYDGEINNLSILLKQKSPFVAYFFNLDRILARNRAGDDDAVSFIPNLLMLIKNLASDKSMIHTNLINESIKSLILSEGIPFFEKNFEDTKLMFSSILQLIKPFFSENDRVERAFLRMDLFHLKYKIELTGITNRLISLKGFLKDLSMNGIALIASEEPDFNTVRLKEPVQIKVYFGTFIFNITSAFITRINPDQKEIGITFDLSNNKMVTEQDANVITKIIYEWIRKILEFNLKKK